MSEESWTYIARKPCGCLTLLVVDVPERKRETAKEVAKAIRLGEIVSRVPTEQVRTMPWKCEAHKKEQP